MRTLLGKIYAQHATYKFWAPSGASGDTDWSPELEEAYRIARYAEDRTLLSPFLARLQSNPTLEHYFSALRCNILRPFDTFLHSGIRVLELGGECGAITRYLGECGAEVCAVEPDMRKAAVTVLRCRDLPNVSVVCDAFADLPVHLGKFDMVTLVGPRGATLLPTLQKARSFLRKSGVLLLAAENRFGLKQFAGVPSQDGCWSALTSTAVTDGNDVFSRKEILADLNHAGFAHVEQFVPIGDHRKASSVLLPKGLRRAEDDGILADMFDVIQPFEEEPAIFNLQAAWHNIVKAGLVHELADSLCFLASATDSLPAGMIDPHVLAIHFGSLPDANRTYGKDVAICDMDGALTVLRRPWFAPNPAPDSELMQVLEDEPYYEGHLLMHDIRQSMLKPGWIVEDVAESFRPWVELLLGNRDEDGNVPGGFLDCCPINIIMQGSNGQDRDDAVAFDLEWQTSSPVPYGVVLVRGLVTTLERLGTVAPPQDIHNIHFGPLIQNIANHFGNDFSDADLASFYNEQNLLNNFLTPKRQLWQTIKQKTIEVSFEGLRDYHTLANACSILQQQLQSMTVPLENGNA